MTIPNETARKRYPGNGVTTDFSTEFVFQSNDQVRVIHVDSVGAETEWTENTEYTLTGANTGAAGTVSVITAPTDYTVQSDEFLVIILNVEGVQALDGAALAEIDATQFEAALDLMQLQINQLREKLSRALVSAEGGEGGSPENFTAWSPVLAVASDGARRVFQVVDWTGGDGTKPDTGAYVGEDDLVADIADGVDVRGATGASGAGTGDMVGANNLSDVTDALASFNALTARGSDKASASTVNLNTATGLIVDITGTTTITAITLTDGDIRICRFTGALTLTNNASIILPGGASITTAAGDWAIFVGYAAGVVRCLSYVKASGLPLVNPTLASLGAGTIATHAAGEYLAVNQDLADLNDPSAARTALGLGTAATVDTGTTANKIVKLDGSAKLPAVDGSQLTGVTAGQPIPTSSTYAVGMTILAQFRSSGSVGAQSAADGNTTSGSNLKAVTQINSAGAPNIVEGATLTGTWRNVSGATCDNTGGNLGGLFARTA